MQRAEGPRTHPPAVGLLLLPRAAAPALPIHPHHSLRDATPGPRPGPAVPPGGWEEGGTVILRSLRRPHTRVEGERQNGARGAERPSLRDPRRGEQRRPAPGEVPGREDSQEERPREGVSRARTSGRTSGGSEPLARTPGQHALTWMLRTSWVRLSGAGWRRGSATRLPRIPSQAASEAASGAGTGTGSGHGDAPSRPTPSGDRRLHRHGQEGVAAPLRGWAPVSTPGRRRGARWDL